MKCNVNYNKFRNILCTGLAAAAVVPATFAVNKTKPNIVIFFVDDMGYNDLGFRNTTFATPNIDRFAKESIDFVNAYIPSPTSSPSRAGLLTGRHPLKVKQEN